MRHQPKWANQYQSPITHYWKVLGWPKEYVALCGERVLDGLVSQHPDKPCSKCLRNGAKLPELVEDRK